MSWQVGPELIPVLIANRFKLLLDLEFGGEVI